jgi:hypothetical protein
MYYITSMASPKILNAVDGSCHRILSLFRLFGEIPTLGRTLGGAIDH